MQQPASIQSPLRHLSIRVPWHDGGWAGAVCAHPDLNTSCLRLDRIADHRSNARKPNQCEPAAGKSLRDLKDKDWPCCVPERGMFMAPFEYTRTAVHPYVERNQETHGHFRPTPLRHPPYAAAAVPFNWMFRESMEARGQEYGLAVDPEREPDLGFKSHWVQDRTNQLALLDGFFGHVKPGKSLCFFYAKEVPFIEDPRRVIVGVGWVKHVGESTEYQYSRKGKLRSMLWERMIQHSIRPGDGDGFLMPYHELMAYAGKHPDFEAADCTAFAPDAYFDEFSYATEHVSHDAAIEALLACIGALTRSGQFLQGSHDAQMRWLHDRLAELWKMRGPCPGLGAALCAFGIEYGTFVAREIETQLQDNEDPWPLVDKAMRDPRVHLSPESAKRIGQTTREKWEHLAPGRRALLKLLSRFNLGLDQAQVLYVKEEREKAGIQCTDDEILANPYLICELTRLTASPVSVWAVDRGMFPPPVILDKHPLPAPSAIDTGTDWRRVRVLTVHQLERAAGEGHTLQRRAEVILRTRELDIEPKCLIDEDTMAVVEPRFGGVMDKTRLKDGAPCYQLSRLAQTGEVIRASIRKRVSGRRHVVPEDWRGLLDQHLPPLDPQDAEEDAARTEKAAALKELAESRFSVLIGPAGTGKTTLLSVLCSHPAIKAGEVLLLAPTGKARVRMEQAARDKQLIIKGFTLAQYLSRHERYDARTGRYRVSDAPKDAPAKTVIVDECSMLTEEMLAALIDCLTGVERLILVGDPRQLPPIGAGRPFVDIVAEYAPAGVHARFPRVGPGHAELTVRRRQTGANREDLVLADWFSGQPMEPGEDEVFDRLLYGNASAGVEFRGWNTPEGLDQELSDALVKGLKLAGPGDVRGFDRSLGAKAVGDYDYFNGDAGAAAEDWQILSPVRKAAHGVSAVNRRIHSMFRTERLDFARREDRRKIPKPMGPEQIVYGDKVINVVNHRRDEVYPTKDAQCYLANGEIGIVVGQFWTPKMGRAPWLMKVAFSSQPGYQYDFRASDFGEESEPRLELAYALTVHKAQGSEFQKVFLIVPNPCRLLSRELLYTALTRHRQGLVVLHQGARSELRSFASHEFSETARRLTNLFHEPQVVEYRGRFYEETLIHRTRRGEMVRSKSELAIADLLHSYKVDYVYEQPLVMGGQTRFPDFTIEDAESGRKIYWEHCGLLHNAGYRERWERKLKWYEANGVLRWENGTGSAGTLIVTRETDQGGFSSQAIEELVRQVILK